MSIPKKRYEVRKTDMSILQNSGIHFEYAGLFQSGREWIHPERIERTYEIIYVTEGEVYIEEAGREHHLRRGQLLLLAPETPHRGTRVTTNVAFYWVHFHALGALPFSQRCFPNFESAALFRELLHYNNLPQAPSALVNAILLHILAELDHLSTEAGGRYNAKAERIYEWVRINADAKMNVKHVASHFGYSPDHLSRICKKAFGCGVGELIDRFLLTRAKERLCNTDKYIKEIAAELAFPTDKSFIAYFKYHEACSPGEFRARFSRTHMNSK